VLEMRSDAEDLHRTGERPGHHRKLTGVDGLWAKTTVTVKGTNRRGKEMKERFRRKRRLPRT
jgi:hypothetical protein